MSNTTGNGTSFIRRICLLSHISRRQCKAAQIAVFLSFLLFNVYHLLLQRPQPILPSSSDVPTTPQRKCLGREVYKEWIDALFALAPPAPNCSDVAAFIPQYKNTSSYWVYGTIVMQRNVNYTMISTAAANADITTDTTGNHTVNHTKHFHEVYEIMDTETKKPALERRNWFFAELWRDANQRRTLPPNLELLVYINDKPRVHRHLNRLPVFVIAGDFPAGSGMPNQWLGYIPFPSHFFGMTVSETPPNRKKFLRKRRVVYFRGQFSENAWGRYERSNEYMSTPRFRLANTTKLVSDRDVLDISMTGFAKAYGEDGKFIRNDLRKKYNIVMRKPVPPGDGKAMMSLSVPGNGWPGATTMRGLLSDTAMLKIIDKSIDNEGYHRDMGEIYFPLLTPLVHYIPVTDYDGIAITAREWRKDTEALYEINVAASEFAQRYLGYECALDIVELLAWRYFEYVRSGCSTAFAHVEM